MKNNGYNTNLASEYYVLSTLYRLGLEAYITLGNKKSIDIILNLNDKKQITIDVKGLKGNGMFPIDNVDTDLKKPNQYIVFVNYLNKIEDPTSVPEIFILPHNEIKKYIYINPKENRKGIYPSRLRKECTKYKNNWNIFKNF